MDLLYIVIFRGYVSLPEGKTYSYKRFHAISNYSKTSIYKGLSHEIPYISIIFPAITSIYREFPWISHIAHIAI